MTMQSPSSYQYRRTTKTAARAVPFARTFQEWVGTRALQSPSTNAGARTLPFQTWHRFKEAFSPELVAKAVAGSSRKVQRLCDPFGGSGTSALAAQFLGVESVSIEVNPFLADLIAAKLSKYDIPDLIATLPRVARRAQRAGRNCVEVTDKLPPTFVEPGVRDRWLFDRDVYLQIVSIRTAIDQEDDERVRRLLTVILGGILVELSNVVVSGKGRRYRRGWEFRRTNPQTVLPLFCRSVSNAIVEIDANRHRKAATAHVVQGDSRDAMWNIEPIDLIVCSPPYPNSFDYTDVYNVELWMLGYLKSSADNANLRRATLSSHVQIKRAFDKAPANRKLDLTLKKLQRLRKSLWDEHIVEMIGGYFADLAIMLDASAQKLRSKGQACFVVGDSQYAGVRVRVADILSDLAETAGLRVIRREPFRSMRLSPQQGGDHRLAESLVVFQKA